MTKRFSVISGGPGTGKTTTVAKILVLLLEQSGIDLEIALAAPTGKAAARLKESIISSKNKGSSEPGYLDCPDRVKEAIPEEASTLHRLLGFISGSPYFRHDQENPLTADIVVVDEASMVDMALMSKLLQALLPRTRLILLGDKNQLASVEAGAVLGDICDTGNIHSFSKKFCRDFKEVTGGGILVFPEGSDNPSISDCIVQLQTSYRFDENSGIEALSRAVNTGDRAKAETILTSGKYTDLVWKPLPGDLMRTIEDTVIKGYESYLKSLEDPGSIFDLFDRFRILCALREGPFGVIAVNRLAERILKNAGLINPVGRWYEGRPVMITRNDYTLNLFNGDVGIVLRDPETGDHRVFFPLSGGEYRKIHPVRLPEHETVFAVTVHKSQGSEFDSVSLVLPDRDTPVLTRELLYTGITRARDNVEISGTLDVFKMAVSRRIERTSGLRDALWG